MDKNFFEIISKHLQEEISIELKDTDLKDLGLDSLASIELLLDLEEHYEVAFPDELLTEETFSNASTLWEAINQLKNNGVIS
ncbi:MULTISPECIES: phosphopantetheine-binding protein [Bacillus cereus group]|uniref:phosphopantetheine-binding protein n=1 Tax=Bacillus cereus group TaxID=86661 RepID=UPI0001A1C6AB|nr:MULTISPECIES: phosphopantetheine-binding protein [Bacillus cereus group]EEM69060.1 acyl carrier protein [Bacillus thuringiensis serovar andalousiensis BGSC 4AW1]MEB9627241.1 phosphopantetheine-binding protein [Bacillus anthracis]OUA98263.1 acyl carrier protein [Bacillus thuringiensis serovar oswaldocruzi]PEC08083.1 acyl carrier protein [Bacillus toyonensis]